MVRKAKAGNNEVQTQAGVVGGSDAKSKEALARTKHNLIRAVVIPINKAANMETNLPEDPFTSLSADGEILQPPFDPLVLAMLEEQNTELRPLLETMETNIDGFGHLFHPRVAVDDPKAEVPPDLRREVQRERVRLENFFNYASLDDSFVGLRRKTRRDIESTGNGYWEVIRDVKGEINGFSHVASYQMRLTAMERVPVSVEWPILEMQEDKSFKIVHLTRLKRFRRFVQARYTGSVTGSGAAVGSLHTRWFKEFGDPRVYDNRTGKQVKGKEAIEKLAEEHRANEILHFALYCPRSPYGLPRYIGNLLSVFGDRAAEEINFITFKNNNIPSMFICVSNGQLTSGSVSRLKDYSDSSIQGSDNYSKFIILEAESQYEGEDANNLKIDVKPLKEEQHRDALFQNYSKSNREKIRGAFRISPLYLGHTEEFTRATADTAKRTTDEQVFAPDRNEFDAKMNRTIFPAMGIIYHIYKSNSPNTTDNTELTKILSGAEKTGGMTPRIARTALAGILGVELPSFPAGFDPDLPFSLTMAEAVKNKADPTEPGQQVTAIKLLKMLGVVSGEDEDAAEEAEDLIAQLVTVRNKLEKAWRAKTAELVE